MMLNEILAVHRHLVAQLRDAYSEALFDHNFRARRADASSREKAQQAHARLTYLVPLQRALNATAQQMVTGGDAGARLYRKKYDALLYRIRDVLTDRYAPTRRELYFGGDIEDLVLLVPAEGTKPANWQTLRIGDLIQRVADALAVDERARLARHMDAENARKTFLASLTVDQRALLQLSLTSAKAKGTHAVMFDQRDLPNKTEAS